jgi:hypothetical protein
VTVPLQARQVTHRRLTVDCDDRRRGGGRADPSTVPEAERRALLVSAAVLMDEALRLLDQGGSSITGVWLRHAIECLDQQRRSPD